MLNVSRRSENRLGAFLFLALLATSCVLMLTTQQLSIQAPQVSSVFLATKRSAETQPLSGIESSVATLKAAAIAPVPETKSGPDMETEPDIVTIIASLVGLLLVLIAVPLLWANECREIKLWRLFGRAANILEEVPAAPIREVNNDRLVCVTGRLSTRDRCIDSTFGVSVSDSVRLTRHVEMYQWEQVVTRSGSRITDIQYRKVWSSSHINSSSFHVTKGHENPQMPVSSQSFHAKSVKLGDYIVPEDLRGQVAASVVEEPKECARAEGLSWTLRNNSLHHCQTSSRPTVGDVRITWLRAPCGDATVIAVQSKSSFTPLKSGFVLVENSNKIVGGADEEECFPFSLCLGSNTSAVESDEQIYCLKEKRMSAVQVFKSLENSSTSRFWFTRLLTWAMVISGLFIVFTSLPDLASYGLTEPHLRFLADVIQEFGVRLVTSLSFWLGTSIFFLVLSATNLRDKTTKSAWYFVLALFFFYIGANRLRMDEEIVIAEDQKHAISAGEMQLKSPLSDVLLAAHHDEERHDEHKKDDSEKGGHRDAKDRKEDEKRDRKSDGEKKKGARRDDDDDDDTNERAKGEVKQIGGKVKNEIYDIAEEVGAIAHREEVLVYDSGNAIVNDVGDLFGEGGKEVSKAAAPVITQLQSDLSDGADNAVAQVGGDDAKSVLHTVESGVTKGVSKGVDLVQAGVQKTIDFASHGLSNSSDIHLPSMREVEMELEPIYDSITGAVTDAAHAAEHGLGNVGKKIEPALEKAEHVTEHAFTKAEHATENFLGSAGDKAGKIFDDAKDSTGDFFHEAKDDIEDFVEDAEESTENFIHDAKEGAGDIVQKVENKVEDIEGKIKKEKDSNAHHDDEHHESNSKKQSEKGHDEKSHGDHPHTPVAANLLAKRNDKHAEESKAKVEWEERHGTAEQETGKFVHHTEEDTKHFADDLEDGKLLKHAGEDVDDISGKAVKTSKQTAKSAGNIFDQATDQTEEFLHDAADDVENDLQAGEKNAIHLAHQAKHLDRAEHVIGQFFHGAKEGIADFFQKAQRATVNFVHGVAHTNANFWHAARQHLGHPVGDGNLNFNAFRFSKFCFVFSFLY